MSTFSSIFFLFALLPSTLARTGEVKLPKAFQNVVVCLPFNVVIRPAWKSDMNYRISYDADDAIVKALDYNIQGTTLTLQTKASFSRVQNPIKLFIELPENKLSSVTVNGVGDVLISGKFRSNFLTLTHNGNGVVYVPSMTTASKLTANNLGSGTIAYAGPLLNVDLTAERSSSTYITSVGGNIKYTGSGTSNTYVQPAKNSITISGTAQSLAKVNVAGSCNVCKVTGRSRLMSPCKCVSKITIPSQATDLLYSCGLTVEGAMKCSSSVSQATTSVSNGVSVARSFASSGSTASSVAITSTTCKVNSDKRQIII